MIMMEGLVYLRGSSSRSISASASERSLLLGALATHMGVLDTRENDTQTVMRKSELWDEITRHFNAHTTTPRSRQQIQTLYKNMKAKARRYEARLLEVASGIPPPDPDPISEMLLGLLHQQLRHQERHLRTLVARDTSSMHMDQDHSNAGIQSGSPYFNPEQMMQVSLSEGAADDVDIKSEVDEDDITTREDPVGDITLPHPFPETPITTSESKTTSYLSKRSPSTSQSPVLESSVISPSTCAPPPATGSTFDQPASPDTASSHSVTEQKDVREDASSFPHLQPRQPLQIPLVLPFGRGDLGTQTSTNRSFPNPLANLSSSLNALKYIASNEELSRETMEQHPKSLLLNPSAPKRQRVETVPRNCRNSSSRNLGCCCPEMHSKLLAMAQEEHYLKMMLLKREDELTTQEHTVKMRILALEEEEARLRVRRVKVSMQDHSESPEKNNDATETADSIRERS